MTPLGGSDYASAGRMMMMVYIILTYTTDGGGGGGKECRVDVRNIRARSSRTKEVDNDIGEAAKGVRAIQL